MNDGPMPPDPFSGVQDDWSQVASSIHGFYSALIAAGFAEGPGLHLTSQYMSSLLSVMFANAAAQQPGQ